MVPGLLWKPGEPHGYDVVEYHLQAPREWYEAGRIVPLRHNAFSFFPFNVEMHYLLAMHLEGGPYKGMYLCQLMHLAMMVLVVLATWAFARRIAPRPRGGGRRGGRDRGRAVGHAARGDRLQRGRVLALFDARGRLGDARDPRAGGPGPQVRHRRRDGRAGLRREANRGAGGADRRAGRRGGWCCCCGRRAVVASADAPARSAAARSGRAGAVCHRGAGRLRAVAGAEPALGGQPGLSRRHVRARPGVLQRGAGRALAPPPFAAAGAAADRARFGHSAARCSRRGSSRTCSCRSASPG